MEVMLTDEQREQSRKAMLGEKGTEPPCPFCGTPRVARSDYIRCGPCAVNWLNEEMSLPGYLERDPRVVRQEAARTGNGTKPTADMSAVAAS